MTNSNNLVSELRKSHEELSGLVNSFQRALGASDNKEARKILERIEDAAGRHFRFEENYLYPRMRRLALEMIDRLNAGQKSMKELIDSSRHLLSKDRFGKDRPSSMQEMLRMVSRYLEDCNDIIPLANKFGKEEESELSRKLKECCESKK